MHMLAYRMFVDVSGLARTERRWELYKLLGEPIRLRLLALAAEEELAIGELAELLGESQPNVSRHLKPLRGTGLLAVRKQGTRVFVRLDDAAAKDPVVADALGSGRSLCQAEGSLGAVAAIVRKREEPARAFFESAGGDAPRWPGELSAYLTALAPLVARRQLAVDAGTGDGSLLEVLAPIFERVFAFDRAEAQLARARQRVEERRFDNVTLRKGELDDETLRESVQSLGGADALFAARVLHHAPRPKSALAALRPMLRAGGTLLVIDYAAHQDERLRDDQADAWLGFDGGELCQLALDAGLIDPHVSTIPAARCGEGPDGHLDWQVLSARAPD